MNKIKAIKKFLLYLSVSLILSTLLSLLYLTFPKSLDSIDNRLRDYFFTIRGEIPNSQNIIIVDIDEKSLQELGQWPWSRNKVAKILKNLTNSEVSLIALDIIFAEEDNSSPHKIFKKYNIVKKDIPNYDLEFAKVVSNTPTLLGYQFEFDKNKKYITKKEPSIPAIFIERNKKLGSSYLIKASGTILNTPSLQDNAYSSGFINNIPDPSGIIRSVPLVISFEDMIYPSLALESLRVLTNSKKVYINYNENGVIDISMNEILIPTDRQGRLLINFRGKERNFQYYSAIDIFNNQIKKEHLKDKIVLIGTSATGLLDLRATPFDSIYPGVEVHANVIDNIIQGDFIYKDSNAEANDLAIIFFLSIFIILIITYTPLWINPFITILFLSTSILLIYNSLFIYGKVFNIFFPIITIIIASIVATLLDYFFDIKKEEAIKKKFASKVSKEVMNKLLKNMDNNEFHAMEREVTVFFSDIRNFTKISENMKNAKELVTYINEYMEPMSNIITKYQGTIDKYIGDSIMAYWNAPATVEKHADQAVIAALKQLENLKTLNKKFKAENKPHIDIGIGLNTGLSIVGEMGSINRSDYTVIGDAINLGARLESLCKYYGSKLNISNFTKDALEDEYIFRFLDLVTVKGKDKPIEIWQIHGFGKADKLLNDELEKYHNAINLYKNSDFEDALKIFIELNENKDKTNNKIYDIYIQRCKEFIISKPKDFNGIYKHIQK